MTLPAESENTIVKAEEAIISFWDRKQIFKKSLERRARAPLFSFYDGPPFATGLPHYGHILTTTIKDSVSRFWTMKGYRVDRRVGWDTHGLPVETIIEKELGIRTKRDITALGVEKFNAACRNAVFRSVKDFEVILKRVGRWADYENAYATLDLNYMESVWWVFKRIHEQGLVYQDFRITPYCPRCATPLSNFEVNLGYKETADPSVVVRFPLKGPRFRGVSILAWTTTPWTLPGNAALAVHPELTYVVVERDNGKGAKERVIVAEALVSVLGSPGAIRAKMRGSDLVGAQYESPYSFFSELNPPYRVVAASFISTKDGTGVVHIAPAYGEDDFALAKKEKLPLLAAVDEEGRFVDAVTPWRGKNVKDADPEIVDDLRARGLLVSSATVVHQYPFCWRCDHPLLYFALKTWYLAVTKVKKDLVRNNSRIHWVPAHLKEGRFGKWLKGARDWAVSRNRFWGTSLPVWQCVQCTGQQVFGSISELARAVPGNTSIVAVRHGESEHNVQGVCNGDPHKEYHLTERGRRQVRKLARALKNERFDRIVTSRFMRAEETTEILNAGRNLPVVFDDRVGDMNFGVYEGRERSVWLFEQERGNDYYQYQFLHGESFALVEERMRDAVRDIAEKYPGEKILLVSHDDPIKTLYVHYGREKPDTVHRLDIPPASVHLFETRAPRDLHRPSIDEIHPRCTRCGGSMDRVPEVFDCWFESGAMPYAQWHYPFEHKDAVQRTFPAHFIAEGLDQTRGWFYTLHVLATMLTQRNIGLGVHTGAFQNVIVNGLILDATGKKLSKRHKNYPDPQEVFAKYGADALRLFLLSSTALGEDYRFSEEGLARVYRQHLLILSNVLSFYQMHGRQGTRRTRVRDAVRRSRGTHIMDRWMRARTADTVRSVTLAMEEYDITSAVRPILELITDCSTWYVRRSRERIRTSPEARTTLGDTLITIAALMAPFAPFIAEYVYQGAGGRAESVHLEDWPSYDKNGSRAGGRDNRKLLTQMERVRLIVEVVHALRKEQSIRVRQPLAELKVKGPALSGALGAVIAAELNVKRVKRVSSLPRGSEWKTGKTRINDTVSLNVHVTDALAHEGLMRDIIRWGNEARKHAGLHPSDRISLSISANDRILASLASHSSELKRALKIGRLEFSVTPVPPRRGWAHVAHDGIAIAVRKQV